MAIESATGNHTDENSTQQGQPAAARRPDIPPRWAFWIPIVAAGIGGAMIGSLFFMAAYVAQAIAYRITFGITAGVCLGLPPLVVWLLLRWAWTMLNEGHSKEQSVP